MQPAGFPGAGPALARKLAENAGGPIPPELMTPAEKAAAAAAAAASLRIPMPVTPDDTIGRAGDLLIMTDNSHIAEHARNEGQAEPVFNLISKILSSGVASNIVADKSEGYKVKAGENVKDFTTLANVIMDEYKANGNKQFKMITIWGHNGGGDAKLPKGSVDPGKQFPGIALGPKNLNFPSKGSLGNSGNGLRFDLASIQAWKDKSGLSKALETALAPGGYIRIASCGYKYDASVNSNDWGESADLMAKELKVNLWVAEGQPWQEVDPLSGWTGNFVRLKTFDGTKYVDTNWHKAPAK